MVLSRSPLAWLNVGSAQAPGGAGYFVISGPSMRLGIYGRGVRTCLSQAGYLSALALSALHASHLMAHGLLLCVHRCHAKADAQTGTFLEPPDLTTSAGAAYTGQRRRFTPAARLVRSGGRSVRSDTDLRGAHAALP